MVPVSDQGTKGEAVTNKKTPIRLTLENRRSTVTQRSEGKRKKTRAMNYGAAEHSGRRSLNHTRAR